MNRRPSYGEGIAFGALSFGCLALISVASSVAIARLYGVRTVGEFALVVAGVNAVTILSSARERPALVRELAKLPPRAPRATALFLPVLGFSTILTAAVGALVIGGAWLAFNGPVHRPGLFAPTVVAIGGFVCLDNVSANIDGVLASFRAGRELFAIRMGQAIALLGLSLALGPVMDDLHALVAALIASQALALVHRVVVARRFLTFGVSRQELRQGASELPEIIRFGLKIAPGGIADGASNEVGTWVLGAASSILVVGAWSRAWMIARQLMFLNVRITEMLFPTLVERLHNHDREGFDRALVDTLRYSAVGLFALVACGGGSRAIMALFGPGFERASDALSLVLAVPALLTLSMILRHALYAFDRPWLATASAGLRLLVTVGMSIPLSIALGPTGAATAVCAGLAADLAFSASRVIPRLHTPIARLWRPREVAGLVLGLLAGYGTARLVAAALPGLAGLLPSLIGGLIAYVAVLGPVAGAQERDLERFAKVRRTVASFSRASIRTQEGR